MIPGYHDQEKFAQAHRQKLLQEAEHQRLLAQLPKPDYNVPHLFLSRTALFLRSFRVRLQKWAKLLKQRTKRGAQ